MNCLLCGQNPCLSTCRRFRNELARLGYVVRRKDRVEMRRCVRCGKRNPSDYERCERCRGKDRVVHDKMLARQTARDAELLSAQRWAQTLAEGSKAVKEAQEEHRKRLIKSGVKPSRSANAKPQILSE